MIYLIAQNKIEIELALDSINSQMNFQGTTSTWDVPLQVNAPSGEGVDSTPAHPVYLIDASKLGWWAILKPEDRFMGGVNVEEIEV